MCKEIIGWRKPFRGQAKSSHHLSCCKQYPSHSRSEYHWYLPHRVHKHQGIFVIPTMRRHACFPFTSPSHVPCVIRSCKNTLSNSVHINAGKYQIAKKEMTPRIFAYSGRSLYAGTSIIARVQEHHTSNRVSFEAGGAA